MIINVSVYFLKMYKVSLLRINALSSHFTKLSYGLTIHLRKHSLQERPKEQGSELGFKMVLYYSNYRPGANLYLFYKAPVAGYYTIANSQAAQGHKAELLVVFSAIPPRLIKLHVWLRVIILWCN